MNKHRHMTVADLRKALDQFEDDKSIVLNVMQSNKAFGVYQFYPEVNDSQEQPHNKYPLTHHYGGCCLNVWLPDGMHTTMRKK